MTAPIDIHALKAAALAAKGNRLELDVLLEMLAEPAAVLTLIERLEIAEQRYRDFEHEVNTGRSAQHERLVARLEKLEAVATAARDLVSEDHAFEKTYSHCVTKTAFVAMRAALAALEDSP